MQRTLLQNVPRIHLTLACATWNAGVCPPEFRCGHCFSANVWLRSSVLFRSLWKFSGYRWFGLFDHRGSANGSPTLNAG